MENDKAQNDFFVELAIRSTLERYFSSVDRKDWKALGLCFTKDARAEYNSGGTEILDGRESIVKRIERQARLRLSNHLLSNAEISIGGPTARAFTHAIAHLMIADEEHPRIIVRGLTYEDELVVDGYSVWRIARRIHRPIWQFEVPSVPLGY